MGAEPFGSFKKIRAGLTRWMSTFPAWSAVPHIQVCFPGKAMQVDAASVPRFSANQNLLARAVLDSLET